MNFNGSNTDGSFTTAVSNSCLSPYEKSHSCRFEIIWVDFPFYIEIGILFVLIRIASMKTHKYLQVEENREDIPIIPPDMAL